MRLAVPVAAGGFKSSQAAFAAVLQQCCSSCPPACTLLPAACWGGQSHSIWAAELKDTQAERRVVEAEGEQ